MARLALAVRMALLSPLACRVSVPREPLVKALLRVLVVPAVMTLARLLVSPAVLATVTVSQLRVGLLPELRLARLPEPSRVLDCRRMVPVPSRVPELGKKVIEERKSWRPEATDREPVLVRVEPEVMVRSMVETEIVPALAIVPVR